MAEAVSKPRLRLTSKGWYYYWTSYVPYMDGPPELWQLAEIWVGPFATASAALSNAVVTKRQSHG